MSGRLFSRFIFSIGSIICLLHALPASAQDGERLAKQWCSSCHSYPEPQLLNQEIWSKHILPEMGARLGFQTFGGQAHRANPNAPSGAYAREPLMGSLDWAQIISWYESNAPIELELPTWQARTPLTLFEIEAPASPEHDFPTSTAIYIDETSYRLLLGDSYELNLVIYTQDLKLFGEVRSGGAISRITRLPSGNYLATIMGGNIGQSEQPLGLLIELVASDEVTAPFAVNRLARRLHRPVDMAYGDFNDNGETDYVTAEFGAYAGKLKLHLSQADGTLRETVLLDEAGATSVIVVNDDLWVLIAQGDERIVRIKDFGRAQAITVETILSFPPSQGPSSMQALDFNSDGLMDLLYTAGDNADISPVFKPYHGVYLFAGQPGNTFHQTAFFHLDGATNAVAEDFDQDGDTDIAAIAYYANIERGLDQAGFVSLQNNNGHFDAKYVEGIGQLGRFVAISAGDIDGDGDQDIALANMAFGPYGPLKVTPELQDQWLRGPRFILLRNGLQ